MASSACTLAKRALVSVIIALGHAYQIATNINREEADESILKAYRRAHGPMGPMGPWALAFAWGRCARKCTAA